MELCTLDLISGHILIKWINAKELNYKFRNFWLTFYDIIIRIKNYTETKIA
jgi:hypothetical protein